MVSYNNSRGMKTAKSNFNTHLARLVGMGKTRNDSLNTATGALKALHPIEPNGVLRALRLNYAKPRLMRKGRPKAAKRRLNKAVGLRGSGKER